MSKADFPDNFSRILKHPGLEFGFLKGITSSKNEEEKWYKIHFFNDNEVISINEKGFELVELLSVDDFADFLAEVIKSTEPPYTGASLDLTVNDEGQRGFMYGKHFIIMERYLANKGYSGDNYPQFFIVENAKLGTMKYKYIFCLDEERKVDDVIEIKDWKINSKVKNLDIVDYAALIRGYQEFSLPESMVISIKSTKYDLSEWVEENKYKREQIIYRFYTKEKFELEIVNRITRIILCQVELNRKMRPLEAPQSKYIDLYKLLNVQPEEKKEPVKEKEEVKQDAAKSKKKKPKKEKTGITVYTETADKNKETEEEDNEQKDDDSKRVFLDYKKWGNNDAVIFKDIIFFLNGYFQEYGFTKEDIYIYFNRKINRMIFVSKSSNRIAGNIEFDKDFPKGMSWSKTLSVLEYFDNKRGYKEFKISEKTFQLGLNKNTYRFKSWLDLNDMVRDDILVRVYYKLEGKQNIYSRMDIISSKDRSVIEAIPLQQDGRPKAAKKPKSSFVIKDIVG